MYMQLLIDIKEPTVKGSGRAVLWGFFSPSAHKQVTASRRVRVAWGHCVLGHAVSGANVRGREELVSSALLAIKIGKHNGARAGVCLQSPADPHLISWNAELPVRALALL